MIESFNHHRVKLAVLFCQKDQVFQGNLRVRSSALVLSSALFHENMGPLSHILFVFKLLFCVDVELGQQGVWRLDIFQGLEVLVSEW